MAHRSAARGWLDLTRRLARKQAAERRKVEGGGSAAGSNDPPLVADIGRRVGGADRRPDPNATDRSDHYGRPDQVAR